MRLPVTGRRATLIRDVRVAEPSLALRRVTSLLHQYYRRSPYRLPSSTCGRKSKTLSRAPTGSPISGSVPL
jgi:hypothetical protein